MGANVAVTYASTLPGAAGKGQESSLVPHSAGDLQALVLATLAESLLYIGGGTEKDTHVVTPKRFAPYSGATHPASLPFPKDEDGVVQVDFPGSKNQAHSSSGVDGVEELLGVTPW